MKNHKNIIKYTLCIVLLITNVIFFSLWKNYEKSYDEYLEWKILYISDSIDQALEDLEPIIKYTPNILDEHYESCQVRLISFSQNLSEVRNIFQYFPINSELEETLNSYPVGIVVELSYSIRFYTEGAGEYAEDVEGFAEYIQKHYDLFNEWKTYISENEGDNEAIMIEIYNSAYEFKQGMI